MNAIVNLNSGSTITMTSLELVDYINSQRGEGDATLAHSDFLKKVTQVLGETVAGNFSGYYKASNGKQNPMYTFPKREACLMAMSYSYDLQAKVFDRMTALEAKAAPIQHLIPQTLSEALRLSADLADQRDQARAQSARDQEALTLQTAVVAEQAPMVQGFERLALAEGMVNGTMAAKLMQMSPHKFFAWLQELGWIRRPVGGKSWIGYQEHVNSGLITHKVYTKTLDDGTERNFPQVMVTSKGLAKLALKLGIDMTKGIFNEYANHNAQPNTPSQLCL